MRGAWLDGVLPRVAEIVGDVRERGDAALLDWTERLDGARPELRVPRAQLASARLDAASWRRCGGSPGRWLPFAAATSPDVALEAVAGVRAERRWLPLASVGIYVPGGRASYPSSLAMAAVQGAAGGRAAHRRRHTASRGGDPRRCVRARDRGGVRGGRGAGRGGARVRHGDDRARRQDRRPREPLGDGREAPRRGLGRDRPSGRAERGRPDRGRLRERRLCGDLLAQAEHGPDSEAILLSLDPGLSAAVRSLVGAAENVSVRDVPSLERAVELSEEHAPEHLELWVTDPVAPAAAPQRRDDLRPHLGGGRGLRGGSDMSFRRAASRGARAGSGWRPS